MKLSATAGGQMLCSAEAGACGACGTSLPRHRELAPQRPMELREAFRGICPRSGKGIRRAPGACGAFGGASRAVAAGNCTSTTSWELGLRLGVRNGEELGVVTNGDGSGERMGVVSKKSSEKNWSPRKCPTNPVSVLRDEIKKPNS